MMHIPIKTNIAADYITWEAGIALVSQQQKEQVEKGAVTMFAFFQCVKECGGGGGVTSLKTNLLGRCAPLAETGFHPHG